LDTGRSPALFNSPNAAGMILAPALLVAFYVSRTDSQKSGQRKDADIINLLIALVVMLGLFATGSRGGVAASALAIAVWWLWEKRKGLAYGVGLIGLLIINPVVLSLIGLRNPDHLDVRVPIWHKTWDLLVAHPVFGLGLRSFHDAFAAFTLHQINYDQFITPYAVHPHNIFLYTWFLFGLLGLLGLLFLLGKAFYVAYLSPGLASRLGACLLLALVIQGMVDNTLWKNDLIVWFVVAFILVHNHDRITS
jgi:O-antigen ligase